MTSHRETLPALRGHASPLLAVASSLGAIAVLIGGARLAPTARVAPQPLASSPVVYVPAGAHAAGANGASWRTDVEVHNPGTGTASFTVQLLKRDTDNSAPQAKAYTLAALQSRRFTDALISEFGFDGAAALRVAVSSGSLVVTSRTYNFVGTNPWSLPVGASFGQFVPGVAESDAIGYGQEGRLIQLTQQASSTLDGFRTNIGLVNTTGSALDVRLDLYRSDGTFLGTKSGSETSLPPYGFRQLNEVFSAWGSVADGWAVVKPTTPGGGLFAFATVIDNHNSGDPIFVPAVRLTTSAGPTPTPTLTPTLTPTPTPTPTTPPSGGKGDLTPYQPTGWQYPVVPDYQQNTLATSFLSAHMNTYVRWAVANMGPADIPGTIRFELRVDGVRYTGWKTDTGLQAGYYIYVENYAIPYDTLTVGSHNLTIIADYDGAISETNEANNSWGKSWDWSSVVFRPAAVRAAPRAGPAEDLPLPPPRPIASGPAAPAPAAAAPGTLYIPASAHASGLNGASWRTDVEVHNPGTTAAQFQITLLPQATDNGGSSPTRTFSLGPQQSVRYVDVLDSVFGTSGAAALRVVPQSGTVLANSRTYNLIGANGAGLPVGASFGQFVPGLDENAAAIGYGEEGRLIQLTHRDSSTYADFRTNVGYVNTTSTPIDLRIDLYDASGALLGTIQDSRTHLRGYEFLQINGIFGGATSWLADGYAVVRTVTPGGRFLAFATVIDNHLTGDPIFIPATKMAGAPPPTVTATPTATATPPITPTATPTTNPILGIEILQGAMTGLGKAGSGTINIADLANTAKNNGLDAALTQIANASPGTITKSGTGLLVNFGNGYTAKDGSVYTGSGTFTTSGFTVSGNHVVWTGVVTPSNVTRDGRALGNGTASVRADYTASGSTVVGDFSGTATGPGASANGSVHVDTSACAKYPVSGSVTITSSRGTSTATFTNACNGSFSYTSTSTGNRSAYYTVLGKGCRDDYFDKVTFGLTLLSQGGVLVRDPASPFPTGVWARGTLTSSDVTLDWGYDFTHGNTSGQRATGRFVGHLYNHTPSQDEYRGTTTYTVAGYTSGHQDCNTTRTADSQSFISYP